LNPNPVKPRVVLSFDVEEHWRIEAAAHLTIEEPRRAYYAGRVSEPTRWLLDMLARSDSKATFFVVGQLARQQPGLVKDIHAAGHEIASHSWEHRRVHSLTPAAFREDTRQSKDVLEQITGEAVVGYRAPTFSVVRQTAWALDVLAEEGFLYDSSIYPVRHDRYGVPHAPRWPFLGPRCRQRAAGIAARPPGLAWLPGADGRRWLFPTVPAGLAGAGPGAD